MEYLSFSKTTKMDIDLTSIIISIIALSFFFIPIMYDQLSKKKGSKKVKKHFLDSAGKKQLNISDHDAWRDKYAIGIDVDAKKILYLKKQPDHTDREVLIDLNEVEKCKVSKIDRNIKSSKQRMNVTDRVELNLSFFDAKKPDKNLEFYNAGKGDSLGEEITLAEKWSGIIISSIRRK